MSELALPRRLVMDQMVEALFKKRNKVATRNFVKCLVDTAHEYGYSVDRGDRIFVHPEDLPNTVHLTPADPVIVSSAPAMVVGRLMFIKAKDLPGALMVPPLIVVVDQSREVH